MRPLEATFRNMRHLHVWMCLGALALLTATVWMFAAEYRRPWRRYQREYDRLVEQASGDAPTRSRPAVEQIWLPELTLDYHFRRVARFDRCTTCHQGVTEADRGFAPPFRSHPRLDLYLGSRSPHPVDEFGCTVCHDGQGSATSFRWASHTPDTPDEAARWRREYDGQPNPHWEWPMLPLRFVESRCLQCHHEVTDLEPSDRHPDPPAPKLLAGYHLIRQNGCFGCHEIDGYDAAGRRIGPDMRLEPHGAEVAREGDSPIFAAPVPGRLGTSPFVPRKSGQSPGNGYAGEGPPGTMRKVGPSLRDTAQKLTRPMIVDRTADPRRFLPATRMPRLFGLHSHLSDEAIEDARRFEPVEIHAIAAYLLAASEPIEPLPTSEGFAEDASPERGRKIFEMQGCLACHKHEAFPEGQSTVGADLSQLGAKYATESGRAWLRDLLLDPSHRDPRAFMPHVPLDGGPSPSPAAGDEPAPTDPVADLMAFLLDVPPYSPAEPEYRPDDLDELVRMHLARAMPQAEAERRMQGTATQEREPTRNPDRNSGRSSGVGSLTQVVAAALHPPAQREGRAHRPGEGASNNRGAPSAPHPAATASDLPGGEVKRWATPQALPPSPTTEEKLRYVGRRTIAKRGCYACHDIPGFEDAPPIGPALTDWGRKRESLLAFEQIDDYLAAADAPATDPFYLDAVRRRRRDGFLWQKLREPRSFDYRLAARKPFRQWLTMGQFDFTAEEREAIATFVLGLTADPPAEKYVYAPGPERRAIVEGRQVLDRFACAECHTLGMEQWEIAYDPSRFDPPPPHDDFDWILPEFSQAEIEASLEVDDRGLAHATLTGMPRLDDQGRPIVVDEDEDDRGREIVLRAFSLWEPVALAGEAAAVGGADVLVWSDQIARRRPPWGGDLARLLYPTALADARAAGANPIGPEAWGWLPPPLVHTGAAVRPDWLHAYLLRPYAIRPAAMMRMPRYNLSSDEAGKLADFFAAHSGAAFPYAGAASLRRLPDEPLTPELQERFGEAMRMLLDAQTYCARCHELGDYRPGDAVRTTLAPDLTQVAARLRGEYLRRWLASPTSILPYTPMPANFPPSGQSLDPIRFPGSSVEQLQSMTDLLLNYDWYLKRRGPVGEVLEERSE